MSMVDMMHIVGLGRVCRNKLCNKMRVISSQHSTSVPRNPEWHHDSRQ